MYEISIEPTSHCQLSCDMCPHGDMSRIKGFMDWNLYCKIIDDIRAIGPIRKLHMQVLGESFLHPRMVDMINYAEGVAHELHVNTNGLPFKDPALRKAIIESSLSSLTFSINAFTRETYEKMQGRDKFEECVDAFSKLIVDQQLATPGGHGPNVGPQLLAKMVLCDTNRHEWELFKAYWERFGAYKAVYKETMDWHGSKEEYSRNFHDKIRWRCHYLWNNMTILWDGNVVPCCIDWDGEVSFGNAKDAHLLDIFTGTTACLFRNDHKWKMYAELCKNCDYWRWDTRFKKIDTGINDQNDTEFRSTPDEL